ncbi:N-formylglutamate amidohydrolase [Roseibium sp.]|uniref:N-formylglutamate amidohydrolase n=1 Tax=Roseibium sp. TaxID=1936156 RepID=UPI00326534E9
MIIVEKGESPLILCLPHTGVDVPPAVEKRFSATGRLQADISWRLEQVLDIARELDATIIRSTISRYVIDVDRPADQMADSDISPRDSLCPLSTLDLKRIYLADEEPGPIETEQRKHLFYQPFHQALEEQIGRLRRLHDEVVLFDCQSMRSRIRGFVEGELPVINIGTANGQSCSEGLKSTFVGSFTGLSGFSVAVDEVLGSSYITEKYGSPADGLQCFTLVIAQRVYLRHESPPFEPDKARIARLKTALIDGFSRAIDWTKSESHLATPKGVMQSSVSELSSAEPADASPQADDDAKWTPYPLVAE